MTRARYCLGLLILSAAPEFAANDAADKLPSFFIPNTGQTDPAIKYFIETTDLRAGFSSDAATFQLHDLTVRVEFAGANPAAVIEGKARLAAHANFLIGNDPGQWKTNLPVYQQIRYRNLYPGIDMAYSGIGRRIKSEFLVAPGGDPNAIRLEYSGADLVIDSNGDLIARGAGTQMREEAPLVYQETGGMKTTVPARYVLLNSHTVGFEIGRYELALPLVIDPTLSYATYLGGSGTSSVTAVAVDASGNLYATGWTDAVDFHLSGPVQSTNLGGVDVFIAKLNAGGNALIYATYIGGRGDDRAADIAVDSGGQAYVTGSTASTNFPVVAAAHATLAGGRDAFALKLNSSGNALIYSTYLGGSNSDLGTAIAADSSGNAYIGGDTLSADFPVLSALQGALSGKTDAFVTKLTAAGAITFSTFLGGASDEHVGGIAIDSSNNIYLAGGTSSSNFPLVNSIQAVNGGSQDVFLTKINSTGTAIVYSTYLGGTGGGLGTPEQANGIAVDSGGNAYIAGVTNSPNFPVTAGAFQTVFNGVQDAFVAKVNPAGSALVYSTYLGSTSFDWASGLAIDAAGNAYVAGYTSSAGFPVVAAIQAGFNGLYDSFVSKLNAQGNSLGFSTLYGGTGADEANAIALDPNGNIFVGGQTGSQDLTLQGALQPSNLGGVTGWLARVGVTAPPPQFPSAVSVSPASGSGNTVTFTAVFSDTSGAAALTTTTVLVNTTASSNYSCQVTYTPSLNVFALANDVATSGSSPVTPGGGAAQNSQCTLNGATSSAAIAGNNLTLTISLAFQPGFPGAKTVYLYAADANSNTGFAARGTWTVTVPPPLPTADSASPNSSTGASQTFTFVFSDTQSPLNITAIAVLFSTSLATTNACSLVIDRNAGLISLLWDNGMGSDLQPINSAVILQNSQCAIGARSITLAGLSNIITIAITFKSAFNGVKNIYMFASENGVYTTGWVQRGTYTVAAGGLVQANSVVPASGSGPSQRFSFTVSDPGGAGFLNGVAVLFSTAPGATSNACYLVYDRTANLVSLAYENPANGATNIVPGSNQVASNNQCTLNGINTTIAIGTTTIVVTLDLVFNASFFGAKNIYLVATEPGQTTGYVNVGTWTVTGGAPTANSVSPASGSGSSPTFTFTVSDSSSAQNLTGVLMLFTNGAPTALANACYVLYNRVNATIGLYGDSGVSLTTKPIGSAATLQNSQCAIGYTTANVSGNSVVFSINTVFKSPPFSGPKTVYLNALEPNAGSGWVQVGVWTVP